MNFRHKKFTDFKNSRINRYFGNRPIITKEKKLLIRLAKLEFENGFLRKDKYKYFIRYKKIFDEWASLLSKLAEYTSKYRRCSPHHDKGDNNNGVRVQKL